MGLELQRNGFGIAARCVWDWNSNGPKIPTQMGPGLQTKWVWDRNPECCSPVGPGFAIQVDVGLQTRWVWDYNSKALRIANRRSRTGMQMDLDLQPILFWDWNPNRSGLATEISLELEPK